MSGTQDEALASSDTPDEAEHSPEQDAATEEQGELAAEQDSEDNAAEETAEKPSKPKGGFQRRISQLTQRHRELEAENARMARVLEQVARERESASAPRESAPSRDSYENYEEYLEARAEYTARKVAREAQEQQLAQEGQRRAYEQAQAGQREWEAKQDAARERFDDYDDMVDAVGTEIGAGAAQAIKSSDVGPDIVMYLGRNPDVLRKLSNMSSTRAAIEVGRIEERLNANKERKGTAPAPITRTRSAGAASNNPLSMNKPIGEWAKAFSKARHSKS